MNLYEDLYNNYEKYCQQGFEERYLPHHKLKTHLQRYSPDSIPNISVLGESSEVREIYKLSAGNGTIKVLLWSQMHGDESTATRALLDVFAFLQHTGDNFDEIRDRIMQNLSLTFVPMLNPDGAERWQRRTAYDIDMNRDAVCNITAEGQLLQSLFQKIKPQYAFNLHDQASYYTAGATPNPATISLLAPPVDAMDSIPENRELAMKLVCYYNSFLKNYIPDCVGKWRDDYDARAFGEHFQRLGAATILIESGGRAGDPERNLARKLNFVMLVSGLYSIATGDIINKDISTYKQIPVNVKENIFDIIYKNVPITENTHTYTCDIGIRRYETLSEGKLVPSFIIEDIGDLTPFGAFETFDCAGRQVIIDRPVRMNAIAFSPGTVKPIIKFNT